MDGGEGEVSRGIMVKSRMRPAVSISVLQHQLAPFENACKCAYSKGAAQRFVNMMLVSRQIASKFCSHLEYFHRLSVLIRRPQHVIFYRCLVRAHVRISECQRRRGRKASVRACTCIETRSWPLKTRATVKRCAAR